MTPRAIHNPFADADGFCCFGCSPGNDIGLKMRFQWDGEEVISTWEPRPEHQGYHNVLHGGIQATLLDEIASWAVFMALDTGGFTSELRVKYLRPAHTNQGPLDVRARVASSDPRRAIVHCTLSRGAEVLTEAEATYAILPRRIAERKMNLPPRSAFLPD